ASVERGGATDLGALLTDAASQLDPKRRGAVVYIGDGQPSVGEVAPRALRDRLTRLPPGTRVFAAALGSNANVALLQGVARGAPVEVVSDAYGAARTALRLLEAAYRPTWVGATVDLGPGVERVLPHELPAVGADEGVLVVGRISGSVPTELTLHGNGQALTQPLRVIPLADSGDLRRRWGEGRLAQLLEEGAGRAAIVDVGRRFGLVSPFTSLYVPTSRETETTDTTNIGDVRDERRRRWKPWWHGTPSSVELADVSAVDEDADNKEGGTGTRAKGEEGSMGNPNPKPAAAARYGVQGPGSPPVAREVQLQEAAQFGMIGLIPAPATEMAPSDAALSGNGAMKDMAAATAAAAPPPPPVMRAAPVAIGGGGGGAGQGIGLGAGHLGGGHGVTAPSLVDAATSVNGRLPPEVIQRIVHQNFGRFRLCYENGLRNNPRLQGRVSTKFVIDRSGAVSMSTDGGSDLPDQAVVSCVVRSFGNLSFPQPESGTVTVVYPIAFAPGDAGPTSSTPQSDFTVTLASVGHAARPCGAAADLPFDDRRALWRERLADASSATAALAVFRNALAQCEAPSWRERY
ncbi:MAG TPA: AgmX/PglI C-terminal domain-containing protein, partial [Polyangiaceae bacterium]